MEKKDARIPFEISEHYSNVIPLNRQQRRSQERQGRKGQNRQGKKRPPSKNELIMKALQVLHQTAQKLAMECQSILVGYLVLSKVLEKKGSVTLEELQEAEKELFAKPDTPAEEAPK